MYDEDRYHRSLGRKTMIDYGLKDKVVLITGGNNPYGIGAATARAFSRQGASVFIHYYRQADDEGDIGEDSQDIQRPGLPFFYSQQRKTADDVTVSIREQGGAAEAWECDLRDAEKAYELFSRAEGVFGQVDVLVNNAADYQADTFLPERVIKEGLALWDGGPAAITIDPESHRRHFSANTRAAAILMVEFARRHIERKSDWGRIINVSAEHSRGCPGEISYTASKHALESYSRGAAMELGPFGITVNVVSPGPVQTGYIPEELQEELTADISLRRIGEPEDIADAVLFFASEQAGWITGQLLCVNGGHRLSLIGG
jgi:3-oxoacyl-[acyl-carrier protein] reductase